MCRSDIHLAAVAALISAYAFRWRHRRICTSLQIPNPPLITCHYGDKKKRTQTSAHSLVLSVSLSLVVSFINSFILILSFVHSLHFVFQDQGSKVPPAFSLRNPPVFGDIRCGRGCNRREIHLRDLGGPSSASCGVLIPAGASNVAIQAAVAARCIHSQQQCKSKCPPYMAPSSQCLCNLACLCPYSSSSA